MRGVAVTVTPRIQGEDDMFGNATYTDGEPVTVDDVLVSPGATTDLEASRPEGVTVAYTLHFPKAYTGDLEGAKVALPSPWGGTYRVIGKPSPYMDANTPTRWHMPVEVEEAHG